MLLTIAGLVSAGLVIALAGLLLIVMPQRDRLGNLNREAARAQRQIVAIQATRGSSSTAGAAQLFELSRAMPVRDDMPGILLALSHAAAASSTTLVSVRPETKLVLADGSAAVPLQVTVDGSFNGVSRFLRILRSQVSVLRGTTVRSTGRLFLADDVSLTAGTTASTGTGAGTGPASEVTANLELVALEYGSPPVQTPATGVATNEAAPAAGAPSSVTAAGTTGGSQ